MGKHISLQDFVGNYEVLATKNKNYAIKYTLIINAKGHFSLDKQLSGYFGSGGMTWEGQVMVDPGRIILQVENCIDWSYTFLDEERNERESVMNKEFLLTLVSEGVEVDLRPPGSLIRLKRVPEKKS